MNLLKYPKYKLLLALLDFILIRASFFVAMHVRGISRLNSENLTSYIISPEFIFFFFFSFIIVLIFQSNNLYKINVVLTKSLQFILLVKSFFYSAILLSLLVFFIHSYWILDSRLAVFYFYTFSFLSVLIFRLWLFRSVYLYLNKSKLLKKKILIAGNSNVSKNLAIQIKLDNIYGLDLAGFVCPNYQKEDRIFEKFSCLGNYADIPQVVEENDIKEIIITDNAVSHEDFLALLDICKQTKAKIKVTSPIFEIVHRKVFSETYFDIPSAALYNGINNDRTFVTKQIFDFFGAFVGLVILSLPLTIIAILIKITSKGPVLFKQARIGKNGHKFDFYKFRSMYVGAEDDDTRKEKMQEFIKSGTNGDEKITKIINESYVTSIGKFLRKTSLDEIPQLLNVLKGEMSLVGPRPCLPYEYEAYDEWHKRRLSVLPGCTGLWQVSSRSEVGFNEMVLLDLYYIDNMSPWLDLQLILKTIPVMILGRGGK